MPPSINLLMLFQKQERSNRMRPQPYKTRHPPPKHPPHALRPPYPRQQPRQTLLLLRAHHPRLDHIHRAADRRRHKPSEERRAEMRGQVIFQRRVREQDALEAVVGR